MCEFKEDCATDPIKVVTINSQRYGMRKRIRICKYCLEYTNQTIYFDDVIYSTDEEDNYNDE